MLIFNQDATLYGHTDPIKWWAREPYAHHRYRDTEEDPYNVTKRFIHAHIL
ncbi:hypothetical protein BGW36DRAFT_293261 [Talaromyces proteolyticus]|uniref:Uncharacterized protein n=1 Tax=Talaromyces proteolyticus TaxID=1131652 RepID=A0AAD4PZJ3_9EURO|nr:uncharacterized protein BGW36DRAFT_293261 [Talaromyces proteolyticus]KAH8699086.1 hypothetical protein BGW36DRAFT_293261 [Talaromyces proteolyticus]